MAKKKMKAAEVLNRQLDTTLTVDNVVYDVNAKHSDAAAKVDNSLTINIAKNDQGSAETILFDGSTNKTLNLVTSDGGRFTGDVEVENHTAETINNNAVLNCADIKKFIVNELQNNAVLYTWDGNVLTGGGDDTNIKSICLVTGDALAVGSFAESNYSSKQFSAYIYIAEDGNIYFGTSESPAVSTVQVSAENAVNALKVIKNGGDDYYDYDSINSISDNLANIINGIGLADVNKKRMPKLAKILNEENTVVLSGVNAGEPSIRFSEAAWAEKADSAKEADSARVADTAIADERGTNIRPNYYRYSSAIRSTNDVGRLITINTASPTSFNSGNHGADGDIWIVVGG